jgi:hypothetical protein
MFTTKMFKKKEPQPRFVNPYGMTDPTSPRPKPTFKDGKLVIQPLAPEVQKAKEEPKVEQKKKKERPESHVVKTMFELLIEDIEYISGETERKKKRAEKERLNKEAYERFLELSKSGGDDRWTKKN